MVLSLNRQDINDRLKLSTQNPALSLEKSEVHADIFAAIDDFKKLLTEKYSGGIAPVIEDIRAKIAAGNAKSGELEADLLAISRVLMAIFEVYGDEDITDFLQRYAPNQEYSDRLSHTRVTASDLRNYMIHKFYVSHNEEQATDAYFIIKLEIFYHIVISAFGTQIGLNSVEPDMKCLSESQLILPKNVLDDIMDYSFKRIKNKILDQAINNGYPTVATFFEGKYKDFQTSAITGEDYNNSTSSRSVYSDLFEELETVTKLNQEEMRTKFQTESAFFRRLISSINTEILASAADIDETDLSLAPFASEFENKSKLMLEFEGYCDTLSQCEHDDFLIVSDKAEFVKIQDLIKRVEKALKQGEGGKKAVTLRLVKDIACGKDLKSQLRSLINQHIMVIQYSFLAKKYRKDIAGNIEACIEKFEKDNRSKLEVLFMSNKILDDFGNELIDNDSEEFKLIIVNSKTKENFKHTLKSKFTRCKEKINQVELDDKEVDEKVHLALKKSTDEIRLYAVDPPLYPNPNIFKDANNKLTKMEKEYTEDSRVRKLSSYSIGESYWDKPILDLCNIKNNPDKVVFIFGDSDDFPEMKKSASWARLGIYKFAPIEIIRKFLNRDVNDVLHGRHGIPKIVEIFSKIIANDQSFSGKVSDTARHLTELVNSKPNDVKPAIDAKTIALILNSYKISYDDFSQYFVLVSIDKMKAGDHKSLEVFKYLTKACEAYEEEHHYPQEKKMSGMACHKLMGILTRLSAMYEIMAAACPGNDDYSKIDRFLSTTDECALRYVHAAVNADLRHLRNYWHIFGNEKIENKIVSISKSMSDLLGYVLNPCEFDIFMKNISSSKSIFAKRAVAQVRHIPVEKLATYDPIEEGVNGLVRKKSLEILVTYQDNDTISSIEERGVTPKSVSRVLLWSFKESYDSSYGIARLLQDQDDDLLCITPLVIQDDAEMKKRKKSSSCTIV